MSGSYLVSKGPKHYICSAASTMIRLCVRECVLGMVCDLEVDAFSHISKACSESLKTG